MPGGWIAADAAWQIRWLHWAPNLSPYGTMRYWMYYAAWMFFTYAMREPRLIVGLAVLLLLRQVLPEPGAIVRALRRSRLLREQVEINPSNVTAARDLAIIYLDVMRPGAALQLLEGALKRTPQEPELLYLAGLALHRLRRHEQALPMLVEAVERDPRVRFGLPYLVAGDSLYALGKFDGALDAYERYVHSNGSDVRGHLSVARAHHKLGDRAATRAALDEAIHTWRVVPSHLTSKNFWPMVSARIAYATLLRESGSVVGMSLILVASAGAMYLSIPVMMALGRWMSTPSSRSTDELLPYVQDPRDRAMLDAYAHCGELDTGDFAGDYQLIATRVLDGTRAVAPSQEDKGLAEDTMRMFANFRVERDRITSGTELIQEFCLTRVIARSSDELHAEVVWHQDRADPGDASLEHIRLRREGETLVFSQWDPQDPRFTYESRLQRSQR